MSFATGVWAYLQTVLLLIAGACLLPARLRVRRGFRFSVPTLVLPAAIVPLDGSDLTGHVYAYTGALSLPGLLLIAGFAARRLSWRELLPERERRMILFGAALAALALYPMALGLGPLDPYTMGYGGAVLPLFLGLGAAVAWWRERRWTAVLLAAVLWFWLLELGESQNLWDYLLDAWLGAYAVVWTLTARIRSRRRLWSCGISK